MQHYGAPTRLLDFTYSIYVAAYFAFERSVGKYAAIWSIDAKWAARASEDVLRSAGRTDVDTLGTPTDESDEATISSLIFGNPMRFAWPLTPFRLNERLQIQKGTFLVPGDVGATVMQNLAALSGYDSPGRVVKILLPRRFRSDALRQLFHMNISATSLFPGLDGYAASLGVYHPTVWHPIRWNRPGRIK